MREKQDHQHTKAILVVVGFDSVIRSYVVKHMIKMALESAIYSTNSNKYVTGMPWLSQGEQCMCYLHMISGLGKRIVAADDVLLVDMIWMSVISFSRRHPSFVIRINHRQDSLAG